MRNELIKAFQSHAKGHIDKHVANVEVLLTKPMGIAEHPDVIETIEKEVRIIADYDDLLSMIDKYFVKEDSLNKSLKFIISTINNFQKKMFPKSSYYCEPFLTKKNLYKGLINEAFIPCFFPIDFSHQ